MSLKEILLKTAKISTGIGLLGLIEVVGVLVAYSIPVNQKNVEDYTGFYETKITSVNDYPRIAQDTKRDCWKEMGLFDSKDLAAYIWEINGRKRSHKNGDRIKVPVYCKEQKPRYL